ncbi:MAG: TIR domain-containing protein, partial [Gammaproteobacteria bacterium]|nr:TIR domain-containing protein [Gammaproteobacteria bacterium]
MVQLITSHLHLENDSAPQGDEWWKWSVWVEGPEEELDAIEHVTYRLHPTFPNPVQRVKHRESKFRFESAGWGEFSIFATAQTKAGESIRLERWLQLGTRDVARGASGGRRPLSVYIAHGLVDAPLVHALTKALAEQGIEVVRPDPDMAPEKAWDEALDARLRSVDAVVPVISNPPDSYVAEEANRALRMDRLVVPIVVAGAKVPAALSEILRLKLDQEENVAELANTL